MYMSCIGYTYTSNTSGCCKQPEKKAMYTYVYDMSERYILI